MQAFDSKTSRWIPLKSTREYKRKKQLLRNAWIIIGLLMWNAPLSAVLVLALLGTFLSFMFLDESQYSFQVK